MLQLAAARLHVLGGALLKKGYRESRISSILKIDPLRVAQPISCWWWQVRFIKSAVWGWVSSGGGVVSNTPKGTPGYTSTNGPSLASVGGLRGG